MATRQPQEIICFSNVKVDYIKSMDYDRF